MTDQLNELITQIVATEDLYQNAHRLKVVTNAGTIAADNKNVAGVLKFNARSGYPAGVKDQSLACAAGMALRAPTAITEANQ